ncbi:hypothetical protein ABIE41_000420 [Bosea sp. OAE506]|uniref:hypothetical protein n=1 Tax=Bosea sp. OAE506 TaxID=2663870 RepID=UPI001789FCC6
MANRSSINDADLLKGAKAIAADMQGPSGERLKLARVIDVHLDWFEQARRRGLEWSDIVALLFRAGAARGDGRPLARAHVQSLVWRKQYAERQAADDTPARGAISPEASKRTARSPAPRKNSRLAPVGRQRKPGKQADAAATALTEQPVCEAAAEKLDAQSDGNALLAYMRRAARLRREE